MKINKKIDMTRIPRHIALIMDGNGRWAKKRGLPRFMGHEAGYKKMVLAVKRCADLGIKVCTIFAFSTENWNRPKDEIDHIFRLIRENLTKDTKELDELGIKVTTMGDTTRFPQDLQDKLREVMENTKSNSRCVLNLCVNYGGRADIVHAVNKLLEQKTEKSKPVTEESFKTYLYGSDLPEPDLIVRTSGEQRVSNFMLYQMAYSEFLFIKTFWPDFSEKLMDRCVIEFQKRKRRYGGVEKKQL